MKAEIIERFIFRNMILCALALLLFITCKSGSNIGKITFWCFDQNGGLVREAELTINGKKFVADAEGKCLFQAEMEKESVELLISADEREGYRFLGPTQVSLKKNEHLKYALYFGQKYQFTFHVARSLNNVETPLSGIDIVHRGESLGQTGQNGTLSYSLDDFEVRGPLTFTTRVSGRAPQRSVNLMPGVFNYDIRFVFQQNGPRTITLTIDTMTRGSLSHRVISPNVPGGTNPEYRRTVTIPSTTMSVELAVQGRENCRIRLRNLQRGRSYLLICDFINRTGRLYQSQGNRRHLYQTNCR